jgi:integrase
MGEKFYGPYRDERGWRVVAVNDGGRRLSKRFKSEADAIWFIGEAQKKTGTRSVGIAREEYVQGLERRGVPSSTRATTTYRLAGLMKPFEAVPLSELSYRRCVSLYEKYAATHKPATHHGALKEAKAFGEWCRKRGWLKANPWADVESVGRKARGKPQHRIDDAVKLYGWLVANAPYDDGACAVLMGLVLGLRASAIVSRTVAHLDDRGRVLWIPKGKHASRAGELPVKLPSELSDALVAHTVDGDGQLKAKDARLIPRTRWWVRRQTHRACELAGVPRVTTHALRGSNATLALEIGETPERVAQHLGHADKGRLAQGTYAQAGAGVSAHVEKVVDRLKRAGKEPASVVSHRPNRRTTPDKEE